MQTLNYQAQAQRFARLRTEVQVAAIEDEVHRRKEAIKVYRFRGRGPFRSTGPALHVNLHKKSDPRRPFLRQFRWGFSRGGFPWQPYKDLAHLATLVSGI